MENMVAFRLHYETKVTKGCQWRSDPSTGQGDSPVREILATQLRPNQGDSSVRETLATQLRPDPIKRWTWRSVLQMPVLGRGKQKYPFLGPSGQ